MTEPASSSARCCTGRAMLLAAVGAVLAFALLLSLWFFRGHVGPAAAALRDPRLEYTGPFRNVAPSVPHVADERCAECHRDIARSFAQHPMGRSILPTAQAHKPPEDAQHHLPFDALGSRFLIEHDGDRVRQRRTRLGPDGRPAAEQTWDVHYVVGSGRRGYSFLTDQDGFLFQTPISWYSQKETWDLSPGFRLAMLTGRAVFQGRSVSDVIAAVLRAEPDWAALPTLHPRIRLLLERCLEKDKASRYHDIADARADLQKALADPSGAAVPATRPRLVRRYGALWWTAAGIVLAAVAAGVAAWTLGAPQDRSALRFSDVLPQDRVFTNAGHPLVAVSPDGLQVVYVANNQLFLRPLDRSDARPIAGTAGTPTTPFFSPDSRFVGYWDFRGGELRRIAAAGGTPVGLVKVTNVFGARWQEDDTILYAAEDGIWKVSADGGTPEAVVRLGPGERAHGPQLLPGGESILFTLRTAVGTSTPYS